MDLRETLRALPTFPDDLPALAPDRVPDDPRELFVRWLIEAIGTGERQPGAMALTSVGSDGVPSSRTLIVKDVDERGLHFSSSRRSRKARDLHERPVATMLFFWRALGRQVEVTGDVVALDPATSATDWRERPSYDGHDNPDWQVWALQPSRWEMLQATHDRRHVRVEYLRDRDGWRHRQLVPSEEPPTTSA